MFEGLTSVSKETTLWFANFPLKNWFGGFWRVLGQYVALKRKKYYKAWLPWKVTNDTRLDCPEKCLGVWWLSGSPLKTRTYPEFAAKNKNKFSTNFLHILSLSPPTNFFFLTSKVYISKNFLNFWIFMFAIYFTWLVQASSGFTFWNIIWIYDSAYLH